MRLVVYTLRQRRYDWAIWVILLIVVSWLAVPVRAQQVTVTTIGQSWQGRPIDVYRFGTGPHRLVVVGATHGAPELNTAVLSRQLIDWFRNHPEDVPPSISLFIVPVLNPDGVELNVRQNARGVDLNRNMNTTLDACSDNDWAQQVYGAYGTISNTGGDYADSEVESRVIRSFLYDKSAVIFLHSAAGLVFPPLCEDATAIAMAQTYAQAADYEYARYWEAYDISGGMHDWARGVNLPAIIPELESGDEPEFERNLAGLKAVMADSERLVPVVEFMELDDAIMPMPIWRFWTAHGGRAALGDPVGPTYQRDATLIQDFTTIRVAYTPEAVNAVVAMPLTGVSVQGEVADVIDADSVVTFAETGFSMHDAIARYYERVDGDVLLGVAQSSEVLVDTANGPESTQQFHFGVVSYDESINRIVRAPVVWQQVITTNMADPTQAFQLR